MRPLLSLVRGQTSCLRIRCPVPPLLPSLSGPKSMSSCADSFCPVRWATESPKHQRNRQWQRHSRWHWSGARQQQQQQRSRPAPLLMATSGGAALGTAAFVKLSEEDAGASGQTVELRMLEASRAEIAKELDAEDRGLSRLRHRIVLFLDLYIWEPLCTGARFLHLAAIFVPVLLAVPVIWFGKKQKDRDNERSGTLFWYSFLVKGMEWAGPAFIKVRATTWQ